MRPSRVPAYVARPLPGQIGIRPSLHVIQQSLSGDRALVPSLQEPRHMAVARLVAHHREQRRPSHSSRMRVCAGASLPVAQRIPALRTTFAKTSDEIKRAECQLCKHCSKESYVEQLSTACIVTRAEFASIRTSYARTLPDNRCASMTSRLTTTICALAAAAMVGSLTYCI